MLSRELQAFIVTTLSEAESFISGFEGDEMQEGVDALLRHIRAAMDGAEIAAAADQAAAKPSPVDLGPRVRKVCETCRGENVTQDALAHWCEESQEWELSSLLDNADCDDCGGETNIDDVVIEVTL